LLGRLARSRQEGLGFSGGQQTSEKLGGLFFAIDGVNAAPTVYQREYFDEVQAEFRARMSEVNAFINQAVPKLNETLRRHNAPTVIAGKPVEI
jgi:hypothetical protein